MAVFRVDRNKDYTVMSNHHLRNREKIDAIREAIRELERAGYIVRSRERDEKGRLRGAAEPPERKRKETAAQSERQSVSPGTTTRQSL